MLRRAEEFAQKSGQDIVGTEHVLWAFLQDTHSIAYHALDRTGDPAAAVAELERIVSSPGYNESR